MAEVQHDDDGVASAVPRSPPPPPVPSTDPRLLDLPSPDAITSPRLLPQGDDIFKVPALVALKLLSAGVEVLVRITGDIPPTPPPTSPTVPHMSGMVAEKKSIVRRYSEHNLARVAAAQAGASADGSPRPGTAPSPMGHPSPSSGSRPELGSMAAPSIPNNAEASSGNSSGCGKLSSQQAVDGVRLRHTPPAEPVARPGDDGYFSGAASSPYLVIGENSQPLNQQHSAITRKFYSKRPPPISITEYLLRIHRFCPMSTAVYLATSLYIHRLAVTERAIAVTRRNAHRLLLAGLRVAMKALEDLSYPHGKMARVGGVSDAELARLEINFCFLAGFELVVGEASLREQWRMLQAGQESWGAATGVDGLAGAVGGMGLGGAAPAAEGGRAD